MEQNENTTTTTMHSIQYDNDDTLISWLDEANAIMSDVRMHVDEIKVSKVLSNSESCIYINIRTKEKNCYCIYVSSSGFRIVGNAYDTIESKSTTEEGDDEEQEEEDKVFESPYALLDKISPSYVQSFGDQLCRQLLHLQQMQMEFIEEDEEEEGEVDVEKEDEPNVLNNEFNT